MNNEKLLYEAPTAQTFVVRFEGSILTGSGFSETQKNEFFTTDLEEDL